MPKLQALVWCKASAPPDLVSIRPSVGVPSLSPPCLPHPEASPGTGTRQGPHSSPGPPPLPSVAWAGPLDLPELWPEYIAIQGQEFGASLVPPSVTHLLTHSGQSPGPSLCSTFQTGKGENGRARGTSLPSLCLCLLVSHDHCPARDTGECL